MMRLAIKRGITKQRNDLEDKPLSYSIINLHKFKEDEPLKENFLRFIENKQRDT